MADQQLPDSIELTDPRALRAYAHPTRLALVGLLRREGPMTATRAADAIGESVASCSFHLRQLAKYGLVEEAGGGRGREKPWRATAMVTTWEVGSPDPAATEALELAVAERYFELMARWIQTRAEEPAVWQEAARFGDTVLPLTAAELRDLGVKLQELMRPYLERIDDPSKRPAHARPVALLQLAFPVDTTGRSTE
ncbi:winged helix-turn-helix domain-containing protein [Nocardia tenerifensis]|uniref:winged helix-turn-helix domain-containing protein n=1 Tax=Nocardia tenerifensis TaxID=228006 RepID=UPI001B869746|nr:helix-turn-helix domain-containing protein [Nocardia tenerifensis]